MRKESFELAKKFSHSLCCIKKGAQFLSPSEAIHGGLGCVKEGDPERTMQEMVRAVRMGRIT
jgi:hypothetical protein